MAAVLNRVILLGTIASEPVLRQVSETENACCFGLTTVTQITNLRGQTIQDVCRINVEVAGARAQAALSMFHQNTKVLVVGRLRTLSWTDPATGRRMSQLVLRASQVQGTEPSAGPVPEAPAAVMEFDPTQVGQSQDFPDMNTF